VDPVQEPLREEDLREHAGQEQLLQELRQHLEDARMDRGQGHEGMPPADRRGEGGHRDVLAGVIFFLCSV